MENKVLVDALIKERDTLKEKINAIEVLLSSYGYNSKKVVFKNIPETPTISQEPSNEYIVSGFPKNGRKDQQVLWLFNNYLTKGLKLKDLQDVYDQFNKDDEGVRIDSVCRRLQREGKLIIVKYNNSNKDSFWGLPEWAEGNDFREENKPEISKLPVDITYSEVIGGQPKIKFLT